MSKSHQTNNPKVVGSDYSQVAAATGINYQNAILITLAFLVTNLLFLDLPMTVLGMIGTTALAVLSWNYFKAYFDAIKDKNTSYAIWAMMGAHVFFALVYLVIYLTDWYIIISRMGVEFLFCLISGDCGHSSSSSEFTMLMVLLSMAIYGSIIIYLAGGIRLLLVRKKHPFPLKRIAIPAMLLIPVLFIHYLLIGIWGEPDSNLLGRLILCSPYIMLLHHFYRVKSATSLESISEEETFRSSTTSYEEDDLV